jgi:predicted nucleotidyltransferase
MTRVHRLDDTERTRLIARLGGELDRRSDVVFAVVFGSVLEPLGFHDVDVGIWTAESAGDRVDLELAVSLSKAVGLPVDVRRLNDAPIPFLFQALRGRVLCMHDETFLADLMERTARAYHDQAPLIRRATAEAFGR